MPGTRCATLNMIVSLIFFLSCLFDWLLLSALPRLQLSFSSSIRLPFAASLAVRLLILAGLVAASLLIRLRWRRRPGHVRRQAAVVLFLSANLGFGLVQVYAYVVEPLLVETTELALAFDDLDSTTPPVRVIQIADLHVERYSFRENDVIQRVNALQPDIIVLTGDYLNVSHLNDPGAVEDFRRFASQLDAPYGIYAVRGSAEPTPESMARLVQGTGLVWLEQETVTVNVRGQPVTLVGVACSHEQELDAVRLAKTLDGVPASAFTILLYHSPDLIREAVGHQVDLYLAGHTHGGQICLPFYGPVVTFSRYGRRYASGLFQEGGTTMVVSRGLGFVGMGLPRVRFLCRPEIVSLELAGSGR
jgi:predicted MPP superfamily phosphohydrolase